MSTIPAVYREFGQSLAVAERTLTALLREHLAVRDITPETWYALQLVGTRGPRVAREAVHQDLAASRNLDALSAGELLARMQAEGLIDGDAELDLTPAGEALYGNLREYVGGRTVTLLSQLDLGDIETTVRTLKAITARATQDSPG